MTSSPGEERLPLLLPELIERFELRLDGLGVLTEAASGPYLAAPLVAALAGAEHVDAIAVDNRFHRAADVRAATSALARRLGAPDTIRYLSDKDPDALARADIVTNSGSVRPIDAATVELLKPTAVVPLMWETWEFVPEQLDLEACRRRGVLVLGTDEHSEPCDMRPYNGIVAVKLLLELGLEVVRTRVLLLGRNSLLGAEVERFLLAAGAEVTTFSLPGDGGSPYSDLAAHVASEGARYDALLVAELGSREILVGPGGAVEADAVAAANPHLRTGVIAGGVDAGALRALGLTVAPEHVAEAPAMSASPADLGVRPVLELYTAGLRVGEVAARARLAGLGVPEAARVALRDAPAMDFPGAEAFAR